MLKNEKIIASSLSSSVATMKEIVEPNQCIEVFSSLLFSFTLSLSPISGLYVDIEGNK